MARVALVVMVVRQIVGLAHLFLPLYMAELVAVGLVDIARLVALAETIIVLLPLTLEALEPAALAEVLAVVVVVLESISHLILQKFMLVGVEVMEEVLALREQGVVGLVALVPSITQRKQGMEEEALEEQPLLVAVTQQVYMAAVLAVETTGMMFTQMTRLSTEQEVMSQTVARAQSVLCGAVADPILLTQRTYNQ